jgi:imidazolonepropionase-like amidohydrolase
LKETTMKMEMSMSLSGFVVTLILACQSGAAPDSPTPGSVALSLQHATLISPGKTPIPNATVTVDQGRIVCVGTATSCPHPSGSKIVDLSGTYLGPGLIDAHVHYSQTGWVDGRPDAVDLRAQYPYDSVIRALEAHPERFHRADLCSGVTSVFDVGGYPWTYQLARDTRNAGDAPRVVAAGPLLATIKVDSQMMGQFDFMQDDSTVRAAVRAHRAAGAEAIKVWYIDVPDSLHAWAKAMLFATADEARKAGLPLIVHATELSNAKEAVLAGAKVLVHNVDAGTIDAEFLQLVKRTRTIVIPTLTVLEGYPDVAMGRSAGLRYPLECVDPATRRKLETVLPDSLTRGGRQFWKGPAGRSLTTTSMDNLGRLYRAGVPIAMGTDAGNPGTAHGPSVYREMELMQRAGMPAAAVFASATIVAARAMGLEGDVGSVERGKRADLAVFDADPTRDITNARRVRFVIRNGVLYSREELLPQPTDSARSPGWL